jgi:hypothetical protein
MNINMFYKISKKYERKLFEYKKLQEIIMVSAFEFTNF